MKLKKECGNCGGQGVSPNDNGNGNLLCEVCGGDGIENGVELKRHKYYLAYQGDDLAASFDAYEDNKQLKVLLSVCKVEGYTVKEVSEFEYKRHQQLAEEKELNRIGSILND